MVKIEIKEGRISRYFLGRRLKKLSAVLALVAALSTTTGKAHAHELDLSGYFNKATVTQLIGMQNKENDKYKTFMEKLTLARNVIKVVYNTEKFDITQLKKTVTQIDSLIDYFKTIQEDYKDLDLFNLLKDLERIKEVILDNLATLALNYSKAAKIEVTNQVIEAVSHGYSFGSIKAGVIKNKNYESAIIILKILEDLNVDNARVREAKTDKFRIDKIFAAQDPASMSATAEQAFR